VVRHCGLTDQHTNFKSTWKVWFSTSIPSRNTRKCFQSYQGNSKDAINLSIIILYPLQAKTVSQRSISGNTQMFRSKLRIQNVDRSIFGVFPKKMQNSDLRLCLDAQEFFPRNPHKNLWQGQRKIIGNFLWFSLVKIRIPLEKKKTGRGVSFFHPHKKIPPLEIYSCGADSYDFPVHPNGA
jgi:hypothetical protein